MADRVGVMRNGKLEQVDAPDELYAHPATAFVAEFVGVMNCLPGTLDASGTLTVLGVTVPVRGQSSAGAPAAGALAARWTSWSGRRA